jgi:hypothetical protein
MSFLERSKLYLSRVVHNDATRRGIAAAGAGFIMAAIVEAVWPTPHG